LVRLKKKGWIQRIQPFVFLECADLLALFAGRDLSRPVSEWKQRGGKSPLT
jgi:hypothetical protein